MIEPVKLNNKIVIAGAQFGALTVMGFHNKLAFCLCKCGNETLVNPEYLLSGRIKLCDDESYNIFEHSK